MLLASDPLQSSFVSEVRKPQAKEILPMLRGACGDEGVRLKDAEGKPVFGCGTILNYLLPPDRPAGVRVHGGQHAAWTADGVITGHFLSPTSDDAAIGGGGIETHPHQFGGTLLMTRQQGKWRPVWYKSGVITRHCRVMTLATGRQLLLCEDTDGGMGHSFHDLYWNDFASAKHSLRLSRADRYSGNLQGGVQDQFIDRSQVERDAVGNPRIRVSLRHGRIGVPIDDPRDPLPAPRLTGYEILFTFRDGRFRATPATLAAAKVFGYQP